MPLSIKAALVWLGFALVAGLNGALRENLLVPRLGTRLSLALSGFLLCILIFALTVLWLPHLAPLTARECWAIGGFWVGLTLLFERLVVRLHRGTAETLGSARLVRPAFTDIRQGKLMLLVLLVTLVAPYLAALLLALI
jgi:hypothetical protein